MAEEQLDVALGKVCVDFSPVLYARVAGAYRLLGKTQTDYSSAMRELNTEIAGRERDRVAVGAGRLLGRRNHARAPKVGERKKKGRSIFDFGVPRRV